MKFVIREYEKNFESQFSNLVGLKMKDYSLPFSPQASVFCATNMGGSVSFTFEIYYLSLVQSTISQRRTNTPVRRAG